MTDTKDVLDRIDQATADVHPSTSPHPQPEPATPETPVPFSPRPSSMAPVPAPHMPDPETPPEG